MVCIKDYLLYSDFISRLRSGYVVMILDTGKYCDDGDRVYNVHNILLFNNDHKLLCIEYNCVGIPESISDVIISELGDGCKIQIDLFTIFSDNPQYNDKFEAFLDFNKGMIDVVGM